MNYDIKRCPLGWVSLLAVVKLIEGSVLYYGSYKIQVG